MGKNQMVKFWLPLLVIMALGLAACAPIAPAAPANAGTPAPAEEATEAPAQEATAEATGESAEEASEEPTAEAPEEAPAESADAGEAIAALVRQTLAQQLQIDAEQIETIAVEAVDWPDACLGVYTADMMCAAVVTPGYRVILAVDGAQYEYHTNHDGSFVQLFSAPEANVGDILISWQQTLDTCQAIQIGTEGLIFGPCMGVQMEGKLVTPEREAELADLVATYAPFEAETAAGIVTFNGQGNTEATPAEQRMIAEWARLVAQEAAAGRSDPAVGVAFVWDREGGLAGFCDGLTAYITGQLIATTCKSGNSERLGQRWMSAEELEQLYAWIDEYAPFNFLHDDGDVDDAMKFGINFTGAGSTEADEETQQVIVEFAADLFEGMNQ
jgi:hypothetical protein